MSRVLQKIDTVRLAAFCASDVCSGDADAREGGLHEERERSSF